LIDASTIKPEVLAGVDMLVIRELTGGAYFGPRKEAGDDGFEAYDTMLYTRPEIERVVRLAADTAMRRRKKLASVDKANVLASSRFWRRVTVEVLQRVSRTGTGACVGRRDGHAPDSPTGQL
jgi:3-isopropylmalate dehydrogenase